MDKTKAHMFHFVIDREMKCELKNLDIFDKCTNLSGVIVKILSLIVPFIEKEHKWGTQRKSKYLPVCNDPDERREHVYVYFPHKVYRQLKLIHQDLNVYSIAQLIRGFLRFFLALVKKYGNNIFKELNKLFNQWHEEDGKSRLTLRQVVQQLLIIIHHFSCKNRLISIYDKQFTPSWIFLL